MLLKLNNDSKILDTTSAAMKKFRSPRELKDKHRRPCEIEEICLEFWESLMDFELK